MVKQNIHNKRGRKIKLVLSVFLGIAVLLILSSLAGERAVAEQADGNAGDNVVSGVEEQTIVVPFWDTKENMKYESTKGTIVYMDNPNVYTIQMKKDGLLCLVFLIGKLEYYYPEIELKDANGKHIKSLDFIEEGKEITEENSSPVYLKAGTYKLEVKYFFEDDYDEDFDGESEEEDNDEDEPTSIRYELEYEIRCSAVEEDVSSSWNLKKTKFRATKDKKMYYKKIKIKEDGLLKVYTQTIDESVHWDFLLGKKIDEEDWATSITLCDKNKKEKGGLEFVAANKEYPAVFALKKGTYYLKIEGENQWYRMWSKFTAMRCGAKTKKKAIKQTSKYKSYLLPAFEKASDGVMWFKFTVKKPKVMFLHEKFVGEGEIDIYIYKGKKKIGSGLIKHNSYSESESSAAPHRGDSIYASPWEKGTYYVKFKKRTTVTQGYIQVKIK